MSEAPPIIKVARSNTSMKGSKYVISTNISDIYSGDVFIKLLASQLTNTNLVPKETTEINLIDKGIEIILPDDIKSTNEDSAISQIDLVKIEGQQAKHSIEHLSHLSKNQGASCHPYQLSAKY
jgi:hypothetical protein